MRRWWGTAFVLCASVAVAIFVWRSRVHSTTTPEHASRSGDAARDDSIGPRTSARNVARLPAPRAPMPVSGEGLAEPAGAATPPAEPVGVPAGDEIHRQYQAAHEASVAAARGCDLGKSRDARDNPRLRLRYHVAHVAGEGMIGSVELLDSTFDNPALDACVKEKIGAARWPATVPDGRLDAPFEDEIRLDELR